MVKFSTCNIPSASPPPPTQVAMQLGTFQDRQRILFETFERALQVSFLKEVDELDCKGKMKTMSVE